MNKCGDCFYFDGEKYHTSGDCFRYPPVVASEGDHLDVMTVTVRPNVNREDRACGEFKKNTDAAWYSAEADGTHNI